MLGGNRLPNTEMVSAMTRKETKLSIPSNDIKSHIGVVLDPPSEPQKRRKPWYRTLYVQVLIAMAIGIALGHWSPVLAVEMKPFGDGFIKLVKMVIAVVIFCTVVSGMAGMKDMKSMGRI